MYYDIDDIRKRMDYGGTAFFGKETGWFALILRAWQLVVYPGTESFFRLRQPALATVTSRYRFTATEVAAGTEALTWAPMTHNQEWTPSPKVEETPPEPVEDLSEIFMHFLATGGLPPQGRGWDLNSIRDRLQDQVQKSPHFFGAPSGESKFCHDLLHLLLQNEAALPRLLSQFGDTLLEDLYAHTMNAGMVRRWINWMADAPGLDLKKLRWSAILRSLSKTGGKVSMEAYPQTEKEIVLYLLGEMPPAQLFRWVGSLTSVRLEKLLSILVIPQTDTSDLRETLSAIHSQTAPAVAEVAARSIVPPTPVHQRTIPDEIYIDNAGLILLHPFLSVFFHELGMLEEGRFIQESLHQRAVLLTQCFVQPTDIFPEYQLILNKLLCGYPLHATLPLGLEDSGDVELKEATNLLQTVLGQWTLNGNPVNSSIQTLRDSFLRRKGKLIRRENDWVLQVEQKAFDMVPLNSLPWNIHMIKHSWMSTTLWVEWV
jgi:hypothetical protein